MKIVDNRYVDLMPFINVTPGDVFEYEERVYIKVHSDEHLGVNVDSGLMVEFNETDPVHVLNVELNILPA